MIRAVIFFEILFLIISGIFSVTVSLVFESRFGDQGQMVDLDILKTIPDYIAIGFVALGTVLSGQEYQRG